MSHKIQRPEWQYGKESSGGQKSFSALPGYRRQVLLFRSICFWDRWCATLRKPLPRSTHTSAKMMHFWIIPKVVRTFMLEVQQRRGRFVSLHGRKPHLWQYGHKKKSMSVTDVRTAAFAGRARNAEPQFPVTVGLRYGHKTHFVRCRQNERRWHHLHCLPAADRH